MSQSDSKIKTISPRSISREFIPREVDKEESLIEKNVILSEKTAANRREFLRRFVPATGNAVAGLLGNISAAVGSLSEDLKKSD